ncbi:sugar kinase, partial [Mycolicibacterium farcinogenes]|nr:sugar kinase [Mycolicibacterium farcinogenes]
HQLGDLARHDLADGVGAGEVTPRIFLSRLERQRNPLAILWMDARGAAESERTAQLSRLYPILDWSGGSDAAEWLLPKA